jgi:hypothetical protein
MTIRKQKKKTKKDPSYAMHMDGEECSYVLLKNKKNYMLPLYERNVRNS